MGEAKRKASAAGTAKATLRSLDLALVARAIRTACQALSEAPGADCLLYAKIGAGLLSHLGVPATAVVGSASWRVGSGDGDVLSHDPRSSAMRFAPASVGAAAMFHAWIAVGDVVIDFTTCSLRHKAQHLDSMDGGKTSVEWAPDYLCVESASCVSARAVTIGASGGLYHYERMPEIEGLILQRSDPGYNQALRQWVLAAIQAYELMLAGGEVQIIGVGAE